MRTHRRAETHCEDGCQMANIPFFVAFSGYDSKDILSSFKALHFGIEFTARSQH